MSALLSVDSITAAILWIIVKATAILALAAIVQLTFGRRASAAARHLVWTLALTSVLLLPVLSIVLPTWGLVVRAPAPAARVDAAVTDDEPLRSTEAPVYSFVPVADSAQTTRVAPAPAASNLSWSSIAAGIYATGVIALLTVVAAQRWRLHRLVRRAAVVDDAAWIELLADSAERMGVRRSVRLLRSRELVVPVTFGTRRPGILIPAIAEAWGEDRRRAVVRHELAHVSRRDCLTQDAALGVCILYWFHPAAWWAARRLRIERELACDDRVIGVGTDGRDYADHLLEIAYAVTDRRAPALALAMARPRQLEGRLLAALDAARNRTVPAWGARLGALAAATTLLVVLSGARPVVTAAGPEQAPVRTSQQLFDTSDLDRRITDFVRDAAAALGFDQDALPGTWEVRVSDTKGVVHLRLAERNSSTGTNVPLEQLEGLTAAQLTGAGGPVQFKIRRDAGTLNFEGVVRNGVGAGTFSFAADPNFPAALEKRGFARPTASEQYQMTRYDIGFAFVDELTKQGYAKPQTADLVRAGQHGVNPVYLREMGSLGLKLGSIDALIELRDHGVSASYARELADLGYKNLGAQDLRQARDHGVTPEYVRELADAGHRNLPLEKVITVRDHGVSAEYTRDMRGLGYTVPIDELVQARDHGVSVEYVREMAALGYSKVPLASLIKLRDHGVSAEYARELKTLGYENVPLDDLVSLRDHGMSAERIRDANKRAGTRLPIDMLKSISR